MEQLPSTVSERLAARLLGADRNTIRAWLAAGKLHHTIPKTDKPYRNAAAALSLAELAQLRGRPFNMIEIARARRELRRARFSPDHETISWLLDDLFAAAIERLSPAELTLFYQLHKKLGPHLAINLTASSFNTAEQGTAQSPEPDNGTAK